MLFLLTILVVYCIVLSWRSTGASSPGSLHADLSPLTRPAGFSPTLDCRGVCRCCVSPSRVPISPSAAPSRLHLGFCSLPYFPLRTVRLVPPSPSPSPTSPSVPYSTREGHPICPCDFYHLGFCLKELCYVISSLACRSIHHGAIQSICPASPLPAPLPQPSTLPLPRRLSHPAFLQAPPPRRLARAFLPPPPHARRQFRHPRSRHQHSPLHLLRPRR